MPFGQLWSVLEADRHHEHRLSSRQDLYPKSLAVMLEVQLLLNIHLLLVDQLHSAPPRYILPSDPWSLPMTKLSSRPEGPSLLLLKEEVVDLLLALWNVTDH
jgi:hypothetical protein